MTVDVTPVFAAYLAGNRGFVPGDQDARRPADYGVSATLDGGVIDLKLTFRAGSAYCCAEWGCHLGLFEGRRWVRLRRELAVAGVPAPDRLELHLAVAVEAGALLFDPWRPDPARRGWYAFAPTEAYGYEEAVAEGGPGAAAEPGAAADRAGIDRLPR